MTTRLHKVVVLVYPYAGGWTVSGKGYAGDGSLVEDPYCSGNARTHEAAVREAIQIADGTVTSTDVTEVYDLVRPPWESTPEGTSPGALIYHRSRPGSRAAGRVHPAEGAGEIWLDCSHCGERGHWGLPCPGCGETILSNGDQARDQPPLGFDSREQLRRYKETLGLDPDEETP